MTQEELNKILENHKHWLNEDCEGWESMRAYLAGANLTGANLTGADLNGIVKKIRLNRKNIVDVTVIA